MMNEHQIYQIDCMNIMLKMELADSQFVGVAQNAPHLALVPAELPPAGFSLQIKSHSSVTHLKPLHNSPIL